jgi:hypothetical protein
VAVVTRELAADVVANDFNLEDDYLHRADNSI